MMSLNYRALERNHTELGVTGECRFRPMIMIMIMTVVFSTACASTTTALVEESASECAIAQSLLTMTRRHSDK